MTSKSLLPALAIALFASTTAGAENRLPFESELNACVSAIQAQVDLGDATRVRHIVRDSRGALGALGGYRLEIDTIVYKGDTSRQHSAVCVTRGALAPLSLNIDGKSS